MIGKASKKTSKENIKRKTICLKLN